MKNKDFEKFLKKISQLNNLHFRKLRESVDSRVKHKKVSNILETPIKEMICPYCSSQNFIRWGKRNDLQRYKCKLCFKTFNSLTKTPLARLRRKGHWLDYAECLKNGKTVRNAAVFCGIHRNTSFRWRHRFLMNTKLIKAKKIFGIIESGELLLKESFKGQKTISEHQIKNKKDVHVLYALDRNTNIFDLTNIGFEEDVVFTNFKSIVDKDSLSIHENKQFYTFFENVNKNRVLINKSLNQNSEIVNNKRIKSVLFNLNYWIQNHFRGVATKYLENYVSWYRGLIEFDKGILPITILYRAKSEEAYKYQPLKVTNLLL